MGPKKEANQRITAGSKAMEPAWEHHTYADVSTSILAITLMLDMDEMRLHSVAIAPVCPRGWGLVAWLSWWGSSCCRTNARLGAFQAMLILLQQVKAGTAGNVHLALDPLRLSLVAEAQAGGNQVVLVADQDPGPRL